MKTALFQRAAACVVSLGLLLSVSIAQAAEKNTFYIGGSIGNLTLGMDGTYNKWAEDGDPLVITPSEVDNIQRFKESDPSAPYFNFIAGFNVFPWLATELHYGMALENKLLGTELKMKTSIAGAYAVMQKGDELYGRLRLGLAQRTLDFTAPDAFGDQTEVNAAIGVSVGQKLPVGQVELMYMYHPPMKIDSDELYNITAPALNVGDNTDATGIKVSERIDTQSISLGYFYTF